MSPNVHTFLKADITKIGSAVDETRTPATDKLHKNTSPATSFLFDLKNENDNTWISYHINQQYKLHKERVPKATVQRLIMYT